MELKELKEKLERGEKIYYAPFWKKSYSGSLVDGETYLYFLTPDSNPNPNLSIEENRDLSLVREIPKEKIYLHYLKSKSSGSGSYSYYYAEGVVFSTVPFLLYIRHRGETGTRSDDRDEIEEAKEVNTVEEFLNLLK